MADKSVSPHSCDEKPPSFKVICENGVWNEYDVGGEEPRFVAGHLNFCGFCGEQLRDVVRVHHIGEAPREIVRANPHKGTNDHDDYDY